MHRRLAWTLILACIAIVFGSNPVTARVDPSSDEAQELAEKYAPIVMLKQQSGPCDPDGEAFAPMSVDVVLDNDDVLLRQAGTGDPVVRRGPVASDLHGRGDGFFLDFNGLSLDAQCVYEQDYDTYTDGADPVVYAHVVQQADRPDQLAVQYWFYWYYNDWNNKHESDWEFIQVLFDVSTIAEALATEPVAVGYAQHEGGEKADWDSDKFERDGTHPVVYPSAGSHASYFLSTTFLGRKGTEGFGCDTTLGPSVTTRPGIVTLPDDADADGEFAWLGFTGRWGERQSGPFNGPTGPNTKPQWTAPIDWHDNLRSASVTIPGGAEGSGTILDTFCTVVDFGSNQLRLAQQSPTQTIVVVAALAFAIRSLARRTSWSSVPAIPLRRRRRTGQMIRGAFESYWTSRGAMAGVTLAYLPAAALVGIIAAVAGFTTGQAVAGFLTTVMLGVAASLIAAFWHLSSDEHDQAFAGAVRLVRERLLAVVLTLTRAVAIVLGLAATVVGIPWAIRQAVRYQFIVPIVVTEGLSGADALARSTELVRGRWWRTAFTVMLFSALAALINSALQLALLVMLGGAPLWIYLAVSFAVLGLVVPLVATPSVLLYGDAAADHRDAEGGGKDAGVVEYAHG